MPPREIRYAPSLISDQKLVLYRVGRGSNETNANRLAAGNARKQGS